MSTILQALFEHQADIIFFLLGLVIGVFYGLQGWHASVKEVHIKDSPRWKNFKWAITSNPRSCTMKPGFLFRLSVIVSALFVAGLQISAAAGFVAPADRLSIPQPHVSAV